MLADGKRSSVGYGRNGQPRVLYVASAPLTDSGTTWDSESNRIFLKSEIPLWRRASWGGTPGGGYSSGDRREQGKVHCVCAGGGYLSVIAQRRGGGTRRAVGFFFRGSTNLRRKGVRIPLWVNRAGRYILSLVDFCKDPSRRLSRCPEASASFFHLVQKFPDLSAGRPHLPYTPDGPYRLETPLTFAARKAVTLGDAEDCRLTDLKKILMKLHVERVLVDSDRDNAHLLTIADGRLSQREVCQALEEAPQPPAAGTSIAATFSKKLDVDFLISDDILALHVTDVFSEYSLLIPARAKNSPEVWDALRSSWVGVSPSFEYPDG